MYPQTTREGKKTLENYYLPVFFHYRIITPPLSNGGMNPLGIKYPR